MRFPNASTALAMVIVDELVTRGVRLFVASPGSRSTALVLAASKHEDAEVRMVLDERSAAFVALGHAKATGSVACVLCTSGTAVANYYPAVVEASESFTSLVVLSSDRPPEMQGIGSNQTIDQQGFFASRVRAFENLVPGEDRPDPAHWRHVVADITTAAKGAAPGPVHLNVMFREPTVAVSDDGRSVAEPLDLEWGTGGAAAAQRSTQPVVRADIGLDIEPAARGLLIAGDGRYDRSRVVGLAEELGWPILATAESGLRGRDVIGSYHHVLAGGIPKQLRPDLVVAIGRIGPSARLEGLFDSAETSIRVDAWGRHIDPGRSADVVVGADPVELLSRFDSVDGSSVAWREAWAEKSELADRAIGDELDRSPHPTGPGIAATINAIDWDRLAVASSLPIRDVDAHLRRGGAVVANRGASGIDGFVSTAVGAAIGGERTLAVAGDLSVLHDSNGFLAPGDEDLVMVVVDNHGGGLFDLLPQARHADDFERLFIAPQNRDFAMLAALHHLEYASLDGVGDISNVVTSAFGSGGRHLIRVPVDRDDDKAMRARLDQVAADAVG